MRLLGRGLLLGLLGLLATSFPARAETSAELNERLRKATSVLSELASGKQDTEIPRGCWPAPGRSRSFPR